MNRPSKPVLLPIVVIAFCLLAAFGVSAQTPAKTTTLSLETLKADIDGMQQGLTTSMLGLYNNAMKRNTENSEALSVARKRIDVLEAQNKALEQRLAALEKSK